jgi:xanthosine utilization system XapX-like protein
MKAVTYEEAQRHDENGRRFFSGVASLIRQDPARKTLRYSVPIAVVVGSIIRLIAGVIPEGVLSLPLSGHARKVVPLLVQLWIFNLLGVIIAHFNSRCSRLSLGLPVASRKLWLTRIVSVVGAGVIPVAIVIFIMSQGQRMFASALSGEVLQFGARIVAGLVLAVVMYQIPSPGVYRISGSRWYVLYVVFVSAGVLLYTIFTPQSWLFTWAPLVAALCAGAWIYATLPPGFAVAGLKPAEVRWRRGVRDLTDEEARKVLSRRGSLNWGLNSTVWRTLLNTWIARTMLALLALYGVFLTFEFYGGYYEVGEYFVSLLWFWILLSHSIRRLHRIDPLPVSRKLPFAHVIITGLLVVVLGSSAVTVVYRLGGGIPAAVSVCEGDVCVPPEFWEVVYGGAPPTVTSPWGESYTPRAVPLVHGGKLAVYNPYECGKDASPQFVQFQVDRALARVHELDAVADRTTAGTPISEDLLESLESGRLPVPASVGRMSGTRYGILAVTVAVMSLLFALLNVVWFRRFRASADVKGTRWFAILFFSLPQVLMLLVVILEIRLNVDAKSVFKLPLILERRLVESLPMGAAWLWLITVVVALVSYVVILRQYEKVEAPQGRRGKHLLSEY